jgi:predicted permease
MAWWQRFVNVFRSGYVDRKLEDELRFHLEARAEDLIREGINPREAAREAKRRFGNTLALRERSRDVKLLPWMESLWQDTRFGLRALRRDRAVTLAAILSLALSIGACTAAFILIDALILRPLPVYQPERLVYLTRDIPSGASEGQSFSYPLFQRLRDAAKADVELLAASDIGLRPAVFQGGEEERVNPQWVSGNLFLALQVRPALGRVLSPADDFRPGTHPVAVLNYEFWMRRFGGNRAVLGQWFTIEDKQFQIIGVAQKDFTGTEPGVRVDLWVPQMMYSPEALRGQAWNWFRILGRLQPGISAEQARRVLQAAFTSALRDWAPLNFRADDPPERIQRYLHAALHVRPASGGPSDLRRNFSRPLWILALVAALVLLIACSNMANLFMARALAREHEMALRISIGAGRGRLVRQVLVEGALIAGPACLLGLASAAVMAPAIVRALGTASNPVYLDLRADWRMVAFVLVAGTLTTIFFALAPALRASGASPHDALKAMSAKHSTRRRLLRPMVAAQLAFTFIVLFIGGMFLVSFERLSNVSLGFVKTGVLLSRIEAKELRNPQGNRQAALELLDRVRQLPGVSAAALSEFPLFTGGGWTQWVRIPGRLPDTLDSVVLPVSPGFLKAMATRLLAGRDFTVRDVQTQAPVALVNEAFVRHYFPGEDPLGKRFTRPSGRPGVADVTEEIVGLVRDAHYDSVRGSAPSTFYIPLRALSNATLELRGEADPLKLAPLVRESVRGFGHSARATDILLQSTLVSNMLIRERLLAVISGFFALVAVVLAAVGLYGVLSYSVARRTREIGIRVALGARQGMVIRLVLSEFAFLTVAGLGTGFAGGKMLARFISKLLYEVNPTDVSSITLPLAVLLAGAAIAGVRPALRAARVDPAVALREE